MSYEMNGKPLRRVDRIERHKDGSATLTLACGHKETLSEFPDGAPPPCFRRFCPVPGCANA